MELTVTLAGTDIGIVFLGEAERAVPLCERFFRGFLNTDRKTKTEVKVSTLGKPNLRFPIRSTDRKPVFEQRLPTRDVAEWLRQLPKYRDDFPIGEKTISSFCLDGLLLFNPDTALARIYLLKEGPGCLKPIFRLFWMYFAQILGEKAACFVHAAALARNGEGHLFLGDSGAGKSTLAEVCTECTVLSDDSPIFCKRDDQYKLFSSPFHQFSGLKKPDKEFRTMNARLKGLYFLMKDNRAYLESISRKKAVSMIIKRYIHYFSYLSSRAKLDIFDLFLEVCDNLPLYNLHFRRDENVYDVITGK